MRLRIRASFVLCAAVLAVLLAPRARADESDRKTTVTFSGPVEIPGHVLPAGTYVFKRLDLNDPNVVEILSADEMHLVAIVLGIPASRLDPPDKALIELREPRVAGAPPAIRDWFYPGDIDGVAFAYPKQHAAQVAQATQTQVPATPLDAVNDAGESGSGSEPGETPASPAPVVAETEKAPASTVDANATEAEADQIATEATKILPKTGSNLPLLALAGLALTLSAIPLGLIARTRS